MKGYLGFYRKYISQINMQRQIEKEFIQAIAILSMQFPENHFCMDTWLIPKLGIQKLKDAGFIVKKHNLNFDDKLFYFGALLIGHGPKKTLKILKRPAYHVYWTSVETKRLLKILSESKYFKSEFVQF